MIALPPRTNGSSWDGATTAVEGTGSGSGSMKGKPTWQTRPARTHTPAQPQLLRQRALARMADPTGRRMTASPCAKRLAPMPKDVRLPQVVPPAVLTHLDHVNRELADVVFHLGKLAGRLDAAAVLPKRVTVGVGDVGQRLLAADRAIVRRRLAVELGRAQQVRVGGA